VEAAARAAMEGGDGTDALGSDLASYGFLGGGKVDMQLVNEAETIKLMAEGKLMLPETAVATEVATLSGQAGKQTLAFRNVKPGTFAGRGFHAIPGVVELVIADSPAVTTLPGVIALMPSLHRLVVPRNGLAELPAGVGKLASLELLDCGHNALTELPAAVGNLLELQTLLVGANRLTALPGALEALQWLTELDLSANLLTQLPPVVCEFAALQTLNLAGNMLAALPLTLGAVATQLDVLDISRNRFAELPSALLARGLPRRELCATDNKLETLDPAILGLGGLQTLRLSRNSLANLGLTPTDITTHLGALERVALAGNLLGPDDPIVEALRAVCEGNGGMLRL
jgi:Leucine-rich repeat (LRR) protein